MVRTIHNLSQLFRMGKGTFDQVVNISKYTNAQLWKSVQYHIFDTPKHDAPLEARFEYLKQLNSSLPSHVHVIDHVKCQGRQHLKTMMQQVLQQHGEGMILRKPNSYPVISVLLMRQILRAWQIIQLL